MDKLLEVCVREERHNEYNRRIRKSEEKGDVKGMVKYTIDVDDETWANLKKKVSKAETLNSAIVTLIEKFVGDGKKK